MRSCAGNGKEGKARMPKIQLFIGNAVAQNTAFDGMYAL